MSLKTAWLNLQDDFGKRFAWSHVKAIFYNYAEQKLLKTKLDEMDELIDAKIAKAMMSSTQVNDTNKVPTSALAYAMNQKVQENADAISQLNIDMQIKTYSKNEVWTSSDEKAFIASAKRVGNIVFLCFRIESNAFPANVDYNIATLKKLTPIQTAGFALAGDGNIANGSLIINPNGSVIARISSSTAYYSALVCYLTEDF